MTNSDQSHESHADGIVEAGKKAPVYFYLLFFGLIAWAVIFMAYYLFSGWSSSAEFEAKMNAHASKYNQSAPAAAATAEEDEGKDGSELFAANCAGCHGADGKGGFGSDLSSSSFKFGRDQAAIHTSITDGRGGRMPAFGGQLSATEIDQLVDFVLELK